MGVGEVSGPRDRAPPADGGPIHCGYQGNTKAPAVAPRGLFVSAHKIGVVDFAKGSLLGGPRGKCVSLNFGFYFMSRKPLPLGPSPKDREEPLRNRPEFKGKSS
jgi:hypothetical protein